jgi:hypothetical protein
VANIDTPPCEDIIAGLIDEGTTGSMTRNRLNKTLERHSREANNSFQVLQQSETLKDFFISLEGHCAAQQANNNQHLTLLCSSLTDNKIRPCIESYITYQMSYEEI